MGSGGGGHVPTPAKRPERVVEIEADDIELGTSDQTEGTDLKTQGKRSLMKPTGSTDAVSGLKI